MNKKEGKVFVWPICTRIIHWTIGLSFSASFFTSFYKEYIHYHIAFGWIFGVMLCYRIIWGFIGPRYAAFNTFRFNLGELKWYFQEKIIDRYQKDSPWTQPCFKLVYYHRSLFWYIDCYQRYATLWDTRWCRNIWLP